MDEPARGWTVLLARLPAEPAKHRMAVWRELRRSGAISIGQGAWAWPETPAVQPLIDRISELAEAAKGSLLVLRADGWDEAQRQRLQELYGEARSEEWAEFLADCDKYLAELEKEIRIRKFTLAELEEEEQSLDRLRRWCRELRARDLLGPSRSAEGVAALKRCEEEFDRYADLVYAALGGLT